MTSPTELDDMVETLSRSIDDVLRERAELLWALKEIAHLCDERAAMPGPPDLKSWCVAVADDARRAIRRAETP